MFIEACRECCVSHSNNLCNHRTNHSDVTTCFDNLCRICTKTYKGPLCWKRMKSFKESLLYYSKQEIKQEIKHGDSANGLEKGGECRGGTQDSGVI